MSTPTAIHKKLVKVAAALGWVEKRGQHGQGYSYAQAVDIFAAVRKELAAENVSFLFSQDEVTIHYPEGKSEQHVTIKGSYVFTDGDTGESVMGHWTGFDKDNAGKALWKALTGGLKYVFITNFLLPTGDDPEALDDDGKSTAPKAQSAIPKAPKPVAESRSDGISDAQMRLVKTIYGKAGVKDTDSAHRLSMALVGKHSTKQMTAADVDRIVEASKAEDWPVVVAKAIFDAEDVAA